MTHNTDYLTRFRATLSAFLENSWLHLLILVLTGIAVYINTLSFPFVFDDRILIVDNPLIKNPVGFFDLLDIDNFLPEYLPRLNNTDMVTSFALRPIAYFTFRLNYLMGGYNPAGYRAVNIAIHIANAFMLYQLILSVIRLRVEAESVSSYLTIPFFAAFLFLVHPLQTESVTYITQRFTSLGTFFYIATILLYLQSLLCKAIFTKRLLFFASVISLLMGMLTKEFLFTAPISLILIEYILLRKTLFSSFIRHIPHLVCMLLIPAILLTLSHDLGGKALSVGSATAISNFGGFSRLDYGITQLRVVVSYLRMLVLPYNLNFDPDYKLYQSLTDPEVILSIFILSSILIAAINLLRRKNRSITDDLVAFSILWFPLLIAVSSTVIPLPDLMSEHRTYLPSIAFCIGVTAHLHSIRWRFSRRLSVICFAGASVVILVFSTMTVVRNQIYCSRLSLWSDTAAKSPNKARPALALGNTYQELGQKELAIAWLSKSIELNQNYIEPYISLGSLFSDLGREPEAIGVYETYLESHPPERRILSNLVLAYTNEAMPDEALSTLEIALKIDPDDERLHLIMAELLYLLDRGSEARIYLADVENLDKENPLVDYSMQIRMLRGAYDGKRMQAKPLYAGSVKS